MFPHQEQMEAFSDLIHQNGIKRSQDEVSGIVGKDLPSTQVVLRNFEFYPSKIQIVARDKLTIRMDNNKRQFSDVY